MNVYSFMTSSILDKYVNDNPKMNKVTFELKLAPPKSAPSQVKYSYPQLKQELNLDDILNIQLSGTYKGAN